MTIFLTGASGYLGAGIARRLMQAGHDVVGLVRRAGTAPAGVREVSGDLKDPASFVDACATADAVIHTAFGHDDDFGAAVAVERAAVDAVLAALKGSDKPVILSSAAGVLGDTGPMPAGERAPVSTDFPAGIRGFLEDRVRAGGDGVRISAMRLPVLVYGDGGSQLVPALIAAARRDGVSRYVGDGTNRLSTVHVDDAADAYVAALHRAGQGRIYNLSAETVTGADLAHAVARAAGVTRVEGGPLAEAQAAIHPFLALLMSMTFDLDPSATRTDLNWRPAGPSLLQDLRTGSYATARPAVPA